MTAEIDQWQLSADGHIMKPEKSRGKDFKKQDVARSAYNRK